MQSGINRAKSLLQIKTVFNQAADYFDAPALSFWRRYGERTIDRINLQVHDRVLDVCCGTGASALPAAQLVGSGGNVLGIDIAENLLEIAQRKATQQGILNIEFCVGDFEHLGLPKESFDVIVCVFGIFFVPDMSAAIQELWRMLKPGGKLAVTSWGEQVFEPATQFFWRTIAEERPELAKKIPPWDRIKQPETLAALLRSGGASQVEVYAERDSHALTSPEDWWTMVLGGGIRGTIEQLDPETRERVRQSNLHFLTTNGIHNLEVDILYGLAQKSSQDTEYG